MICLSKIKVKTKLICDSTAATCIAEFLSPSEILAIFGAFDLNNPFEGGRYQLVPKRIFIHEDWKPVTKSQDADLSLLEFEKGSIKFNHFVQPVRLWNSDGEPTTDKGFISVWNETGDETSVRENIPKIVEVSIYSYAYCFNEKKSSANLFKEKTFCVAIENNSEDIHNSNRGAGLFIKIDGVFYLRGIVSSSFLDKNGYEVPKCTFYTNFLKFRDWIEDSTGVAMALTRRL